MHPRLAIVILTVAATLSASVGGASAQDRVVRSFAVGAGADAAGVSQGGDDVESNGPAAINIGPDGRVYVLDQVNGRILSVDPNDASRPPQTLELPGTLTPTDMVSVNGTLYVWDGQIHSLEKKPSGTDEPVLEARSVGAGDEITRSAFAQMGSQTPAGDDEILAVAAGRSLQPDALQIPIKQQIASRGLGPINVDIVPRKDLKSALLEVRQQSDPLNLSKINVRVTDRLGSVEVLDVLADGDIYVFAENVPTSTRTKPATYVARYSRRGQLERVYDLPISEDQAAARRQVSVGPKGNVLFLRSDAQAVKIIDLDGRTQRGDVLSPPPAKPLTIDEADLGDDGLIAAVRPNTRAAVIQAGLQFEAFRWTVSPANYGADPDTQCTGFQRIRRPWYIQGKAGQEVRGVPYCWGCFGTLAQFKRRIDRGTLAGNVCTKDDPRRDAAGVDCSAFVSATWGLSRHYTTRDIPSITQVVANPWDMKPGDALNKPGSHVMLFLRFTPDRKVEVLEAATGGCNGRVCRNIYPLSTLLARGYTPVRYTALTD